MDIYTCTVSGIKSIMDIHNWIMDIRNYIMDYYVRRW